MTVLDGCFNNVKKAMAAGGRMVSCTECGEWYHEEGMPYQNKFGEKTQSMSGIVTTVEYILLCTHLLNTLCVHLDMLNMK